MLRPWWVKRFLFKQNKMFVLTLSFQLSKNNICIYYVIDWISLHAESNLRRVSFDILFSFVVYHLLNMNIKYSYNLQSDGQCLQLDLGSWERAGQNFPLVLPMYTALYAKGVTGRKEVLPMYILTHVKLMFV